MTQGVFDLNPEQQKAFNRLKKAYKDCEKLGVFFVNHYGRLYAYDKEMINGYGDSKIHADSEYEVSTKCYLIGDDIKIANEWTDDQHYYGMTKKGFDLYMDEYGEEGHT